MKIKALITAELEDDGTVIIRQLSQPDFSLQLYIEEVISLRDQLSNLIENKVQPGEKPDGR